MAKDTSKPINSPSVDNFMPLHRTLSEIIKELEDKRENPPPHYPDWGDFSENEYDDFIEGRDRGLWEAIQAIQRIKDLANEFARD
jgi:hypothetical protein